MDKFNEINMLEHVEFAEINENVLTACMTVCMGSMGNDSGSIKK